MFEYILDRVLIGTELYVLSPEFVPVAVGVRIDVLDAETELLRAARRRGYKTMDGGHMNVGQALGAFKLFTGLEPDAERMMRHFKSL